METQKGPAAEGRILPQGQGEVLTAFGVGIELLLTGKETGGTFALYAMDVDPGTGAPPHVHRRDDETFYVEEGELEVWCNGEWQALGAGGTVFLPKNAPHAFRNSSSRPARAIGMAVPAGHGQFFRDADYLAKTGTFNPETAAAVCLKHGIELLAS